VTAGTANSTMNENTTYDHTSTGMREIDIPVRAAFERRHQEVDRADRGRDADEHDTDRPEIHALAGRIQRGGQRCVGEPAAVGRGAEREARVHHQPPSRKIQ